MHFAIAADKAESRAEATSSVAVMMVPTAWVAKDSAAGRRRWQSCAGYRASHSAFNQTRYLLCNSTRLTYEGAFRPGNTWLTSGRSSS